MEASKNFIISKPTQTQQLYTSNIVVSLDMNNNISIIKNRYENIKKSNLNVKESIDILLDMFCRMIYDGRMEMFQEATKIKLIKMIMKELKIEGNKNEKFI